MAESFAMRQSKAILARSGAVDQPNGAHRKSDQRADDLYAVGFRNCALAAFFVLKDLSGVISVMRANVRNGWRHFA